MQRDHSGDSGERFWDCYVPRCSRFKSDASSSESRNSRIFCLSKLLSLVDPHRTRSSDWLTAGSAANWISFTQASQLLLLLRKLWLLLPSLCFPNSNKIFDCSVSSWTFCHCRYTLQLLWNKGNFLRMASKGRWSSCIYMRRCHFPSLRARTCNSILCIHVLIKKTTN